MIAGAMKIFIALEGRDYDTFGTTFLLGALDQAAAQHRRHVRLLEQARAELAVLHMDRQADRALRKQAREAS